jgi:hypothetical protein
MTPIKIDPARLLGFRAVQNGSAATQPKLGLKAGEKAGGKPVIWQLGPKLGQKAGTKPGNR